MRNASTLAVFSAWRSSRRDSVSTPCSSRNAANGEIVAPVSRSRIARMYVTNAAGPTASANDTPW